MTDLKVKVFVSFSHEDERLRVELAKHLKSLERQGKVELWYDGKIEPGTEWLKELNSQLNSADIILLLISSSFVDSDFCYLTELEQAKKRHDAGDARIIPIFLRWIDLNALEGTPLQTLQGLPEPNNPITSWEDQDKAFAHVATAIRKVVTEVQQKKEAEQARQAEETRRSPMRSQVSDAHYIERDQAKKLLQRFAIALEQPQDNPLLFNIYGIGGVGKTTLLGRLQDAHTSEVDFLGVCFAKTAGIETPLKLMRKLHKQSMELLGSEASSDSFTQWEKMFTSALFELSQRSIDGGVASSEESRKITSWFERFIWLGSTNLTSTSNIAAMGDDAEGLQEWIQQRVRNHPATKDRLELQLLMLEPVLKLTQAFAESLMQVAQVRERSLVLVLDTYEKAQAYLSQWLWQYLVEDTSLSSASVRIVVVGRRSLQADEGWRKLNQDRKLLYEVLLQKFDRKDTEHYLKQIGIQNGGTCAKIHKATQGLPYYLDWVRRQREQGEELDFSKGNQAIAELLLQGVDSRLKKILQVVACCRWFDLAMIRYLLGSNGLGLQQDDEEPERYFDWLKRSDFIEFTRGHYRLDDVTRDVFRQSYFLDDQNQFRRTNALLADYFKQQANEIFDSQCLLPDPYEDEEWRGLMSENLYYSLFGKGKEGLRQYIEQVFTAAYLGQPDVFIVPFAFINVEINEENQNLLPQATDKFFKTSGTALRFGWFLLGTPPKSYKLTFKNEDSLSEKSIEERLERIENSLQTLLEFLSNVPDGFGKTVGLMYKSLRCNRHQEMSNSLLQAQSMTGQILTHCRPKLLQRIFSNLGLFLRRIERYQDSLDCYEKALELDQYSVLTFRSQGNTLCDLERYNEALESYQKALDLDSKSSSAWSDRSHALRSLRRYDEALSNSERALEVDDKHLDALNAQALALSLLKNFEKATAFIDKAISLDSQEVLYKANRGIILARSGRYTESLAECEHAIHQDPKNESGYYAKACCYALQGETEQAIDSLRAAIDIASSRSRREARQNPDFDSIRDDERFRALVHLN